jgi:hypothetical protein
MYALKPFRTGAKEAPYVPLWAKWDPRMISVSVMPSVVPPVGGGVAGASVSAGGGGGGGAAVAVAGVPVAAAVAVAWRGRGCRASRGLKIGCGYRAGGGGCPSSRPPSQATATSAASPTMPRLPPVAEAPYSSCAWLRSSCPSLTWVRPESSSPVRPVEQFTQSPLPRNGSRCEDVSGNGSALPRTPTRPCHL